MTINAFVSFKSEDQGARDALTNSPELSRVSFISYPNTAPWDNTWQDTCREILSLTFGTIVLVGKNSHHSTPITWEISETIRLGKRILGVQIDPTTIHPIPDGLRPELVVNWNPHWISREIEAWRSAPPTQQELSRPAESQTSAQASYRRPTGELNER
ncbi:TIR domain-containing protein [Tessaracoccus caeni]|uniref:TIR domain-containing protein n=1 Tax=Tessaracoccus caeni TaxID=3031239 RepID=UPI003873B5CA